MSISFVLCDSRRNLERKRGIIVWWLPRLDKTNWSMQHVFRSSFNTMTLEGSAAEDYYMFTSKVENWGIILKRENLVFESSNSHFTMTSPDARWTKKNLSSQKNLIGIIGALWKLCKKNLVFEERKQVEGTSFSFFLFFLRTQFCKLLRKINIIYQELLLYLLPSHPCLKWVVSLTLYPRPYTLDPKRLISFKLSFLYRKTYHIGQSREKCNFISKCGRRAKRCSGGRIWNKEREYFAPLNVDHFNSSVLFYRHAQLSLSHLNF